jgi:hypothetical protein
MKTNKVLFEVQRETGTSFYLFVYGRFALAVVDDDESLDEVDPSAGRFVQYRFPPAFLKLKQVGAL